MKRRAIICCFTLLPALLAAQPLDAQDTLKAEAANLQDFDASGEILVDGAWMRPEDLPAGYRLFTLTSFLVGMIQNDPDAVERYSRRLVIDRASLTALADFYGDFNERLGERQEIEMKGLEDQPEARAIVGRQLSLDLFTHGGETLGRWLARLRDQGTDVERLVATLLYRPGARTWRAGTRETREDFDAEASAAFAIAFEREFGSAPEALVRTE